MKQIPREGGMTASEFVVGFLAANRPVIITGVASEWPSAVKWTPDYFRARFGHLPVQVYDHLFTLVDLTSLTDYLSRNFDRRPRDTPEYARWYSRLRDLDIPWSDAAFGALAEDWEHPSFLPRSDYLVPYVPSPKQVAANLNLFPYRGLFLCGRGGRTRLHRDPFGTQAILLQVYGRKQLLIWEPACDPWVRNGHEFADPQAADPLRFPYASRAEPAFADVLHPGEILFIPDGWYHDIVALDDSISVTWNFVHKTRGEVFLDRLASGDGDSEIDVLRFFLRDQLPPGASMDAIRRFFFDANSAPAL